MSVVLLLVLVVVGDFLVVVGWEEDGSGSMTSLKSHQARSNRPALLCESNN